MEEAQGITAGLPAVEESGLNQWLKNQKAKATSGIKNLKDSITLPPQEADSVKIARISKQLQPHLYGGEAQRPAGLLPGEGYSRLIKAYAQNPEMANALSQLYDPLLKVIRASDLDSQTLANVEKKLRSGDRQVITKATLMLLGDLAGRLSLKDIISAQSKKPTVGLKEYDIKRGICGAVINSFKKDLKINQEQIQAMRLEKPKDFFTKMATIPKSPIATKAA